MGILIKGMKMPEAGEHILSLYVYHDGTATIIGQYRHYEKEPFEVIPVPPHCSRVAPFASVQNFCPNYEAFMEDHKE